MTTPLPADGINWIIPSDEPMPGTVRAADAPGAEAWQPVSESLPDLSVRLANEPPRDMLIAELLARGEIAMLHGEPRVLKSWIAYLIALCLAARLQLFGLDRFAVPTARNVLIVGNEDGPRSALDRCRKLAAGLGLEALPAGVRVLMHKGFLLEDPAWQVRAVDEVEAFAIDLVVLDSFRSTTNCADAGPRDLAPATAGLRRIIDQTGAGFLLVHHDVKPDRAVQDTRRRAHRASGGGVFSIVEAPIHAERIDEGRTILTPSGFKHSGDPAPVTVRLEIANGWARLTGETTDAGGDGDAVLNQRVLDYLESSPGSFGNAVARGVRSNKAQVLAALEALCRANRLDSTHEKRGTRWFLRREEATK